MTAVTDLPGGVVHELPQDLREALATDRAARATWTDIARPQRVDLLDHLAEEGGDAGEADRLGLGEPPRRQAPPLLLAGLPAPVRSGGQRGDGAVLGRVGGRLRR